jgi:hypothetical protein
MNAGTYQGKIMDWGLKHYADKDEYKIFVKFELSTGDEISWHGSLDDSIRTSKNGKDYTMLSMTQMNLKTLGYKYGEDLEAIITQPEPFDRDETFSVEVASFVGSNGRDATYVKSFGSAKRPKEERQSNVKTLEDADAKKVLSALMTKKGFAAKKTVNAPSTDEIPF